MGRFTAGNSADSERLERIMNAKQRLIGVDVQALAAQVEAKQHAKAKEQAEEMAYANAVASQVGMLTMSHLGAAKRCKEWNKEIAQLRTTHQGKPTTREWDLNRPDAKKRDLPARLGDDDPRCGPASLQVFAGEDLQKGERESCQMSQCKAWWDEQMAVADQARQQQQLEAHNQGVRTRTLDALQLTNMEKEKAARATLEAQAADENAALRAVKAARQSAALEAEKAAKQAELQAAASDPWLNESPEQAASALSSTRVRKDHWKGMSAEQLAAIKKQQEAQVELKRAAAAAAAAKQAEATAQNREVQRAVLIQAQSAALARRQQAAAVAAALKDQMVAKVAKDAAINKLYANQVTEDYFQQFGTSAR